MTKPPPSPGGGHHRVIVKRAALGAAYGVGVPPQFTRPFNTSLDMVFIGDQIAQRCALVCGASTRYTKEDIGPGLVFHEIAAMLKERGTTSQGVVMSTGLTADPLDREFAGKAVSLASASSIKLWVLGVSSRTMKGRMINVWLSSLGAPNWVFIAGFKGTSVDPTVPTVKECWDMLHGEGRPYPA